MLINRSVTFKRNLETFRIIGTDDYWTGIPRFAAAPKRESENRVLISHNPDYVSFLLENTACEFDLALSGHTHGGQIKLPIIGALGYNVTDARFGEGLVHHKRGEVFTTRGLGVVEIPVRINCPPEVSILTLTHA